MSIAAQRFKYLDKETNVPIKELKSLLDNQIYNAAASLQDTALAAMKDSADLISKVTSSVEDLKNIVSAANSAVMKTVKDALNKAIDTISNLEMPAIAKNILSSLKSLDLGGVKDFLQDMLHVGSAVMCNNLDFLKLFMLGYAINKNIVAGLLTGLLLSWMDRYCKGFTKQEMAKSSPISCVEKIVGSAGAAINASNVFSKFTETYSSFLKANSPVELATPESVDSFLSSVSSGNVASSISNLRESEISSETKGMYLSSIDEQLASVPINSAEYNNLLTAKGQLSTTPLVSSERRDKSISFSNLSDQLGNLAKKVANVDIKTVTNFTLEPVVKSLQSKIGEFKKSVASSPDILTRSSDAGSFSNANFASVLPAVTQEEQDYMSELDFDSTAHRVDDLHPTSELFLA